MQLWLCWLNHHLSALSWPWVNNISITIYVMVSPLKMGTMVSPLLAYHFEVYISIINSPFVVHFILKFRFKQELITDDYVMRTFSRSHSIFDSRNAYYIWHWWKRHPSKRVCKLYVTLENEKYVLCLHVLYIMIENLY